MNNMFEILENAVRSGAGFQEAQALYSETFRDACSFDVVECPERRDEMVACLMLGFSKPHHESCDWIDSEDYVYNPDSDVECDEFYDEYYDLNSDDEDDMLIEGCSKEEAEMLINNGLRFVDTCNYKGEGEGIVPELLAQNMRVFVEKYNYI